MIFFFVPIAETLKSSKISEENFCVLMVKETSVTRLDQAAFLSLTLNAPCSRSRSRLTWSLWIVSVLRFSSRHPSFFSHTSSIAAPFSQFPSLCLLYWMNNFEPPADRELPLCHTLSDILSLILQLLKGIFLHHRVLFSLLFVSRHMFLLSPPCSLHFSLLLWQVAVRLCKLNLGNLAWHQTSALDWPHCRTDATHTAAVLFY